MNRQLATSVKFLSSEESCEIKNIFSHARLSSLSKKGLFVGLSDPEAQGCCADYMAVQLLNWRTS
jgi:hypothetical protein